MLLLCLTCEGQDYNPYTLLLKGQASPYDTAVSIEIHQYRNIRQKVIIGDEYIGSLKKTIDSLDAQVTLLYQLSNAQTALVNQQQTFQKKNEKAFDDLSARFDKLAQQLNAPKVWYERPLVILGSTVVAIEALNLLTRRR